VICWRPYDVASLNIGSSLASTSGESDIDEAVPWLDMRTIEDAE
jgi:hypothetical protein